MRRVSHIFTVLALAFVTSCASRYELLLNSNDVLEKYDAAFEYYNAKKYKKSAELFESLQMVCSGTPQGDTVRFYQALSNFKYGDMYTAEANLEKFVDLYPLSPFTEEASYLRIICLYENTYRYELDQEPTKRAINEIKQYLYENPSSEYVANCKEMLEDLESRLERKAYESAKLYYTIEDYKAAVYALRNVLKDDSETRFREEIKYYIALAAYKYAYHSIPEHQRERYINFIDYYYDFIGEYRTSKYRDYLDMLYIRVQRNMNVDYVVPAEYKDIEVATSVKKLRERRRMDKEMERMALKDAKKAAKDMGADESMTKFKKKAKDENKEIKQKKLN